MPLIHKEMFDKVRLIPETACLELRVNRTIFDGVSAFRLTGFIAFCKFQEFDLSQINIYHIYQNNSSENKTHESGNMWFSTSCK